MKLDAGDSVGDSVAGGEEDVGGGAGALVLVAVRMDAQSRELLTWALVKVAEPGDRVLAIHVLNTPAENTSSLLSLVQKFDSVLAVYEGFCNLKQVDLKLKVCRGSSVSKTLVEEAKTYAAAKLIVGTSKTTHAIRSSVSVAKYCSRKLPKSFSVFAVENGKVLFQRDATETNVKHSQDVNEKKNHSRLMLKSKSRKHRDLLGVVNDACGVESLSHGAHTCLPKPGLVTRKKSRKKKCSSCGPSMDLVDNSGSRCGDGVVDNSLALVPVRSPSSNAIKSGWPLLRKVFLPKPHRSEDVSGKKTSVVERMMRLPGRNSSSAVVYPDQKHCSSDNDDGCLKLNGENGAIVSVGCEAHCPLSPSSNGLPKELEGLHEKYSATCRLFSYQELLFSTSDFKPENLVGKGGSSHVYKGSLPDGKELAVKILKPSEDVLKEFVLEIDIITTLSHKNIISLFGYCFEDNNLLLVYDFLSRGSLEDNLHGNKKDGNGFGWGERYKVAVGVAEALDYLHNGCAQPIIHRDVKSSNILLSDDFEPQLSDFGLANWVAGSSSHMTCTDVAGTFGYLAPEYFMHGKVSDKIDVYAFGVVLLELLSGRKPINSQYPKGQESLVMWAKPILKDGKVSQLLDPTLESEYDQDQIERMVLAATICIRRSPRYRPQISIVLKLLQGEEEVTKWAKQQVNIEEELDDGEEEAFPSNIQSHLDLALLDLEDDTLSTISSINQSVSIENYLQGRWSRTSSFD